MSPLRPAHRLSFIAIAIVVVAHITFALAGFEGFGRPRSDWIDVSAALLVAAPVPALIACLNLDEDRGEPLVIARVIFFATVVFALMPLIPVSGAFVPTWLWW